MNLHTLNWNLQTFEILVGLVGSGVWEKWTGLHGQLESEDRQIVPTLHTVSKASSLIIDLALLSHLISVGNCLEYVLCRNLKDGIDISCCTCRLPNATKYENSSLILVVKRHIDDLLVALNC